MANIAVQKTGWKHTDINLLTTKKNYTVDKIIIKKTRYVPLSYLEKVKDKK